MKTVDLLTPTGTKVRLTDPAAPIGIHGRIWITRAQPVEDGDRLYVILEDLSGLVAADDLQIVEIPYHSDDELHAAITRLMADGKARSTLQLTRRLFTSAGRVRGVLQRMLEDGELTRTPDYKLKMIKEGEPHMKWTEQQIAELTTLAASGKQNAELAEHFSVPVKEIHAVRSKHNITRAKLAAAAAETGLIDPSLAVYVEELSRFLRESVLLDVIRCYLTADGLVHIDFLGGGMKRVAVAGDTRAAIANIVIEACL